MIQMIYIRREKHPFFSLVLEKKTNFARKYLETDNYYNNNGQYYKKNCRTTATAGKKRGEHT